MWWAFLVQKWKPIVFFAAPLFMVLTILWISQNYVQAYLTTKTVRVYPTLVTAEGWQQSDLARARELPADATLPHFTKKNAAYVVRGLGTLNEEAPQSAEGEGSVPEEAGSDSGFSENGESTNVDAIENTQTENSEADTSANPTPVPNESAAQEQSDTSAGDTSQEVSVPAETVEQPAAPMETPAPASSDVTAPSSGPAPAAQPAAAPEASRARFETFTALPKALRAFLSVAFAQPVFAQSGTTTEVGDEPVPTTMPSSTPPVVEEVAVPETSRAPVPDVAACTVTETECFTLESSGFTVDALLREKRFEQARLSFSFASAFFEEHEGEKISIRYLLDGTWRHAGEIYLNKEFSNGINGGYFTHALDGVSDWEAIRDLRVVVEYEARDGSAEMYLDALWIDVDYKERAQDVLDGNVLGVSQENTENADARASTSTLQTLVLADGERITFPYTDDLDDVLMMRADKETYRALPNPRRPYESAIYVSVTNTSDTKDSFRLITALQGEGRVREVSEYVHNVPSATSTPISEDVTYLCDSGWKLGTSSLQYVCSDTREVRECSWVNDSKENCLVSNEIVGVENTTVYSSSWMEHLQIEVPASVDLSDELPEGYIAVSATDKTVEILPGQTSYFRILLDAPRGRARHFALYALGESYSGDLLSENLREEGAISPLEQLVQPKKQKRINERISTRTNFEGDELPEFAFRFKTQRGFITRAVNRMLGRENTFTVEGARIRHMQGELENVPVDITYEADGGWTLSLKERPRGFKPGKYTVELSIKEGFSTYKESVEFYWGVLALNPNKSVYEPGERAYISMAALDDVGSTICNATLELVITNPDNGSERVSVIASPECGPNNVIDVPDYTAYYYTSVPGTYRVSLSELDREGALIHHIEDSFEVREDVAYDVARTGPTRIYPKAPYEMEIEIRAKQDFSGTIVEAMPLGFEVLEKSGGELSQYGEALRLSWNVNLKAGELTRLRYTFDAPDISPYLYLMGPLVIRENDATVFEETRSWKIASDALGSYVEKASSWSPASTGSWIAKDLSGSPFNVPANAVLEIAIVNSDVDDERVGGVRHASSSLTRSLELHEAEPQGTTEVVMHVQASATSSIQTFAESAEISYVLLGYWTSGYYVERINQIDPGVADNTWGNTNLSSFGVASGTVAEMVIGNWNETAERNGGVRRSGSALSRLANLHEAEGAGGGTQGISATTMMVRASTTNATIQVFSQVEGANGADVDFWLIGFWSQNPTGLDYTERFDNLTGPTSGSTWTDRALDSFGAGANSIAEVVFANAADANLSQLLGVRTNGSSIDRSRNLHEAEAGGWSPGRSHVLADATASATIEYFTDDTANDLWRLMGYWAATNTPPAVPTLYNQPFESEKMGTSTPIFVFSATDPDGSSDIVYQIQWDDDYVLDDAPLGDRTSSNETGCSPNCFTNLISGGDTSPFTEGQQVRFSIQSSLVSGTTYYWRVRATDINGSAIQSDWSDIQSFTYVSGVGPSQWFQTQSSQFESGALSSTETTIDNTVTLSTTAPVDAFVAYAEGTVQTPRYRTWNGTAWSAEGSAQSVGGTIQWMMTKAGTTRHEYILGTQDSGNDVNVQVFNGTSSTWSNLQEVVGGAGGVADNTARGFDIAYESTSGDALVVYCDGDADPAYYTWNGISWASGGTINLSSANNCEWIKLASDPASDEIMLVARDTGIQYEAQVWNGSSWSNSNVLGSMAEVLHEGIAVEYEESGNQALVVVSNGGGNNFAWSSWDGSTWGINTTHALGDDFEWGVLKADDGSDNMALCYVDNDDDIGIARWDGAGWQTAQEIELTSNVSALGVADGKPVSCEFETTTGRDGYIMVPYSDTTNGRYQVWNGSSFTAEASISTVQDSWTVDSIRTGDGLVLSTFWDDTNGRYDFSFWDGSGWSTLQTLENSASVTAEPYRNPIAMAARIYQASSGTFTSDPVDFDWVPSQLTWGEALWNTIEPSGTDVKFSVFYGSTCATIVPDIHLPGNSTGYDASASPLNLSGLSTSTYNQICLKATLTSSNQSEPEIEDWTISWERQPYLTQSNYRWYVNANSATVSDPWPAGATDLNENETIPQIYGPSAGSIVRLRMALLTENVALSSSALSLTLQYAQGLTCSASMTWLEVGGIGSTTAAWRGYNNSSPSDGATLPSRVLLTTDASQTYEEENDSALNPTSISVNEEGEWDWVLEHNATDGTNYCFRVVTSAGEVLNEYDVYPSLVTNRKPNAPTLSIPFDNERLASTSPWFEFVAEDTEGNDITYQIQVDNDNTFASTVIDTNSQSNITDFTNMVTPSDKDPYNSGQTVRYVPASALTDGVTYYWRVRGRDRNASNTWGDWSSTNSFTVTSAITISTWYQTEREQFDTNSFDDTESTSTDDVILTPPLTTGTTTSSSIDFDWHTTGNAWGELSWNDTETSSDIKYHVEYLNAGQWSLIPNTDLPGNAAGYDTSPISLLGVDPTTYNEIRIRANLTNSGATPRLLDWTVEWGFAVEQPTLTALFDNEKTGTTTPTFEFLSSDPDDDDLVYQISWSTTPDFAASTTRISSAHAGFSNVSSTTDTSPFVSGDTIQFKVQPADALTNNTTYWWRVRAVDINAENVWSVWSPLRSFTVDTTVEVSTWFQTTDEQFDTNVLDSTEPSGTDSVEIASLIREAFTAYAEGTVQAPRFRVWNGETWGAEATGVSVGDTIRFVESAASPTRDEYIIATQGSTGRTDVQVVDGTIDTAGNRVQGGVTSNILRRGFDVAYESDSGDALMVTCAGTEAVYRVWNGASWTATTSITLAITNNCEWIRLAADPESDEMVMVVRDTTAGASDYEALVWNGSSWGNSSIFGSQITPANEGMSVEYEESGGQAVVIVADGANNNFLWNAWNGSWSGATAVAIRNDFAGGKLVSDNGSDEMALCYTDIDNDLGVIEWNGSGWGGFNEVELTGNNFNGRPISCEYETTAGRDNYLMVAYSDDINVRYQFWNGATFSVEADISTITDSWEIRTARAGDGTVLTVAYDDANTEYDFSSWNGTSWSVEEVLETTSITTFTPATIPIDIVARRYPTVVSGSVTSDEIDFDDGSGLKWDEVLWSDTTPGASDIAIQVQYYTGSAWALIPDGVIPGNSLGATTSPINLGSLNTTTYNEIRLVANFTCVAGNCPTLNDWTITWAPGLVVSGTAQEYDRTSNVTSGTVAVAVNGVLQVGRTGSISAGAWSISNVTVFTGDVVTVYVEGANDEDEAVAVTVYDGVGDVTGMQLYERHLTLGSPDNPTISNAQLSLYDNSVSGDEDIFHEVDAGNDLSACLVAGCDTRLLVRAGTTYRPDSGSSGNVSVHDVVLNGFLSADGNTITVSGSWDNNGTFTAATSTVVFSATSTTETIDGTGATTTTFFNATFGSGSGSATWSLSSTLDVNGALTLSHGTLSLGSQAITLAGNLAIGANGIYQKGTGSLTFDGSDVSTWTDASASKQDIGSTTINGLAKTISLGSNVKATNVTIGADDTLSAGSSYTIEVQGNWTNNNTFTAQNGTVNFTATTTGRTITPGSSSFYNLSFNGVDGNWAFSGATLSVTNDFTIATGTVTMPTGTTTIAGNFSASTGTFMHNNGTLLFTASSAKVITPGVSSMYDTTFNGSGSWTFGQAAATSSRNVIVTTGTLTAPSGVYAIGGSFARNGGTFTHNSGTLKFTSSGTATVRLNNSDAGSLWFSGSGAWSFVDTNATSTGSVSVTAGTLTLPSGVFAIGGSFTNSSAFTHNSGTVRFNSSDTGETIDPGSSWFNNLLFQNATGGWTIAQNATSSGTTTIASAASFTLASGRTLEVRSAFVNQVGGATTTWSGSTLYLNSGTRFSINATSTGADSYGTLLIGPATAVSMWNSESASVSTNATGSLYSRDHAGFDGDLYIWGAYTNSGSEYWSYATDFDGTALGGAGRQVDVRFAPNASYTFSNGTLQILGTTSASTTIANQGSGTYAFAVTGGTLNAGYYQVRNTNAAGISLSGTPTVTSLSNGDFELGVVSGGTSLTIADSVIDANPALEIQRVAFSEGGGYLDGYNVIATGAPSSYWWFRNHYGSFDGEANDSDPGGDPGNIRWDDSGFTISVSGTVYSDDGETPMGNPVCDNSTPNVRVVVNGGSGYTGSCASADGTYTIPGVSFNGDAVITAYLNTGGGVQATTVTRTPSGNITGLDLHQDTVITRHEGVDALTIGNMAVYDSSDDADILFAAATGSPDTLTTAAGTELHIWTGDTFAPGGNVTIGGGAGAREGRLHIATSSVFTAAGTQTHTIAGGLSVDQSAILNAANSTFTFTATSNKIIRATPTLTFYNVTFNGSGGAWDLQSLATTTVQNALTMSAGTLSGRGSVVVQSGSITGDGVIAMTAGAFELQGAGTLGGASAWQFHNLILGSGSASATTTKVGAGQTTIRSVLTVRAQHELNAGSSLWQLTGGGTPFQVVGTFTVASAPFTYSATSSTNVADEVYATLTLAPSAAGSPQYAIMGGTLEATDLTLGNGTNPVTVTADANDPSVVITNDFVINVNATHVASNLGVFQVGGSWTNAGTFTPSGATVTFNSTDTGETINAGSSAFYNLTFNNAGGGWTISNNATSTNNTTLTAASSFTVSPNVTLSVGGAFTNSVGGAATTWTNSTLYLTSSTTYSANTKINAGDTYSALIASSTRVSFWNSSAASVTTLASSSVYSQDHDGVDGDLYIWGVLPLSSGSNYWSYATDFDGTSLGGSSRQVNVRIASSSSVTLSGGVLDILGSSTATTTIAVQGTGRYSFAVSGGTFNANYYSFRNLTAAGLNLTGSPTITSLSYGDYELDLDGGTLISVAGTVIDANVLKVFASNRFATSSAVATGTAVTATGSTGSSWKFNLHYGNIAGEDFDIDPQGDPGYIRWDDSATDITISGNVYSDEGTTVSSVCNGVTQVVRLKVQGLGSFSSSCSGIDGSYSIPNVFFNPGDTFTVFLDTEGGAQAANVTVDTNTNIANMHLYENRVIVRHEDAIPITIADMALYDSDDDADIPFTATDAGTDTLVLPPEKKLIVWNAKTFAPAGNITLNSGGSGDAHDGTLELYEDAILFAALTQSHSIGGSFIVGTDASLSAASSTFTFAATTTGKTITLNGSSFYDLVFNGTGGNWAFSGGTASTTNNFTISNGTVTLPTGTTTIGGSFQNTGGSFMHNNGTIYFTAQSGSKTVQASGNNFYNLTFNGGSTWAFSDTNATSSNNFIVMQGTTTAPSGILTVGGSLDVDGRFQANSGTVRLTSTLSDRVLALSGSSLNNLIVNGSGSWLWGDTVATTTGSLTISQGTLTLPSGTLNVGGSFLNSGTFNHATGTVRFNSTDTGETINPGSSSFYDLTFSGATGGWTVAANATSTGSTTISAASSLTVSSSVRLAVGGFFRNMVGGASTTWTGSTLFLYGSTTYAINTKAENGDTYATLRVASSTHVSLWNSSADTLTTTSASSSIYSQDHAGIDGDLSIWGVYTQSSGAQYWSHATDFDGTALGGSSRQVDVRIAPDSRITIAGGTFAMIGTAAATSTVAVQSAGTYAFEVTGGTLNANYYSFRNLDADGLNLSGAPTVTSLSRGDFELGITGGTMMTVSAAAIDANASKVITNVSFATSSGVSSGFNVVLSGSPVGAWNFDSHYGNYDGESYDSDGGDACGNIRWDDSACLFVSQSHYRWRADNGGEGAPSSDWFNASWTKRKRLTVENETVTSYTNLATKVVVSFDSDMQSDFDDLRFTDDTGTTSIPYWIEDYTAGSNATVWVQVPELVGSSTAVVYMYYGNAGVVTSGDGETVFEFFDDFEDGDIAEYSGNTTLFQAGTAFNYIGSYGLQASTGNEDQQTTGGIYRTGALSAQGDTIRFFQYVNGTGEDEPCAYFGVQGSGSNYAVCLDQYPAERIVIAENVSSNDGSGTYLASTTVNFATGWYEVVIDWFANGTIDVTVYDDLGSEFATVQANDTSHSSGGVGFGFWAQNGGWDYYSVKSYTALAPSYSFGLEQGTDGASWNAAEDTALGNVDIGENVRVRFAIENTGDQIDNQEFRLQVAEKGAAASCEAVPYVNYSDVPTTTGGCGSSPACMTTSSQITNQASTTQLLSSLGTLTFAEGKIMEDPSNQTNPISVGANQVTEVEYNFQLTESALASSYCFRASEGGLDLDNYDKVAQLNLVFSPFITNFSLNGGVPITLTEGATTTVYATGTVTDFNGWEDIAFATSTIYRSDVGAACSPDDNDCYQIPVGLCQLSSCAGNSCALQCRADLQYIADPTDIGLYSAENWRASVQVEDQGGLSDVDIFSGVELLSLFGLRVDSDIDFGALEVGNNTGAVNATTTVNNTGNTNIDIQLEGTDLAGSGDTIPVGEQKYATTTFVYSSCVICSFLTGTATNVEVDLPKPTSTTSPIQEDVYWGINVPTGTAAEYFEGVNTFWATSD